MQEFGDAVDRVVGDAFEDVVEVEFRVVAVERSGTDQGIDGGGAFSAMVGAGEEEVLAAEGDSADILPMSARKSKFTIAGTRFMGVRFAFETANSVAVGTSSMWTTALAQSWWYRDGCWIPCCARA